MNKVLVEQADVGQYKIFINEEKRTVVVLFEVYNDDLGNIISKEVTKHSNESISLLPEFCDCYIVDNFRGIAKCHQKDKFDETTGIRIAKARARIKYLEAKAANLYKAAFALSNAALAIGKRCKNIEKKVKQLCFESYQEGMINYGI